MRPRTRRAFTYIEMAVALIIVGIMAAIVVPNMVAVQGSRQVREFKSKLVAYCREARSRAIETGHTVSLLYDKEARSVQSVDEGVTGSHQVLHELKLPAGMASDKFLADQSESNGSQWRVPIFPDGTSAGGGAEFEANNTPFSFVVDRSDALPRLLEGPLPDLSLDHWSAGGYAKR